MCLNGLYVGEIYLELCCSWGPICTRREAARARTRSFTFTLRRATSAALARRGRPAQHIVPVVLAITVAVIIIISGGGGFGKGEGGEDDDKVAKHSMIRQTRDSFGGDSNKAPAGAICSPRARLQEEQESLFLARPSSRASPAAASDDGPASQPD